MVEIKITPRGIRKPQAILDLVMLERKLNNSNTIRYRIHDLDACIKTTANLEQPDLDAAIKLLSSWLESARYQRMSYRQEVEATNALSGLGISAGGEAFLALHAATRSRGSTPVINYAAAMELSESLSETNVREVYDAVCNGMGRAYGAWDWVEVHKNLMSKLPLLEKTYTYPLQNLLTGVAGSINNHITNPRDKQITLANSVRRLWRSYLAEGGTPEIYDLSQLLSTCEDCVKIVVDGSGFRVKFKNMGDWEETPNENKES